MHPNDEVTLHLTGKDAVSAENKTISVTQGRITHIEGDWVTVEFPRSPSEWEICAAKGNFQRRGDAGWILSLD